MFLTTLLVTNIFNWKLEWTEEEQEEGAYFYLGVHARSTTSEERAALRGGGDGDDGDAPALIKSVGLDVRYQVKVKLFF